MTEKMDPKRYQQLRDRHVLYYDDQMAPRCRGCFYPWPCETHFLLDEWQRLANLVVDYGKRNVRLRIGMAEHDG